MLKQHMRTASIFLKFMTVYVSTNLNIMTKKYPQSLEDMIKMKKVQYSTKRCFFLLPEINIFCTIK